jgi:O-antigen ligase
MKKIAPWLDIIFSGTLFKLLYLALALISFNAFIYYLPVRGIIVWIVTGFGALNLLYRLINYKRFGKMPYLLLLGLFAASYAVTVVAFRKYGLTESVQGLVWMLFQFLLLYVCDMGQPAEKQRLEFKWVSLLLIGYNTLASIASLVMVMARYGEVYRTDLLKIVPRGFIWGRLWGVFTDPNYGSVSVCISILLCLYLLSKATRLYQKLLGVFSLAFSFLYLVFSDSRTGLVTLCCSLFIWSAVRFSVSSKIFGQKINLSTWPRRAVVMALSLVVVVGVLGATIATKSAYNVVITNLHASQGDPDNQQIDREYYDDVENREVDISNRRFDLWFSGLEIFRTSPLIGVGFRNFQAAAADKVPNTYLLVNSLGKFDAFHNMWVDILVSQGLIGLILFLAFALGCAWGALRLLSRLFLSDTVYVNTPNAVMFWILIGYLMRFIFEKETAGKLPSATAG